MHVRTLLISTLAPLVVIAQSPVAPSVPHIVAGATAEVELRPDRATLIFTVESRSATAARAGAETARKQRGVLDTLRVLGVAADQMGTASIEIHPEFVYPGENRPPRVSGYVARNSVRVDVQNIERTGALIDAALAKEASGIGSLQFRSSRNDEGRRQALELAVAKAKAEADAMARAAGGALGALMELSAQPSYDQPAPMQLGDRAQLAMARAVETPVAPGQIKISATVTGKWGYSPR